MRESIQVTIARPFWATPVSSEYLKDFTYSAFASVRSLKESAGKEFWDIFNSSAVVE
jgi:hypothetical protein